MSEVKVLAEDRGLEIAQPESLKEDWIYRRVVEAKPDYINSGLAFGQLVPKKGLGMAPSIIYRPHSTKI